MVSKRSTVALEPLGAGQGRACRAHPMVQELQEKSRQTSAQEKLEKAAQARIHILMLTAHVRAMHTMRGTSLSALYAQIEQLPLFSPEILRAVQDEVAETGAVMSGEEITDAMSFFGVLNAQQSLDFDA